MSGLLQEMPIHTSSPTGGCPSRCDSTLCVVGGEEEEFNASRNWRGEHNSLSHDAGTGKDGRIRLHSIAEAKQRGH